MQEQSGPIPLNLHGQYPELFEIRGEVFNAVGKNLKD